MLHTQQSYQRKTLPHKTIISLNDPTAKDTHITKKTLPHKTYRTKQSDLITEKNCCTRQSDHIAEKLPAGNVLSKGSRFLSPHVTFVDLTDSKEQGECSHRFKVENDEQRMWLTDCFNSVWHCQGTTADRRKNEALEERSSTTITENMTVKGSNYRTDV